jgi:dihydrodipicolinate reductase
MNSLEAEVDIDLCEFEASMAYRASSRTARTITQRNQKKKKKKKKKEKKKRKRKRKKKKKKKKRFFHTFRMNSKSHGS